MQFKARLDLASRVAFIRTPLERVDCFEVFTHAIVTNGVEAFYVVYMFLE
jgi:hypothetical protein